VGPFLSCDQAKEDSEWCYLSSRISETYGFTSPRQKCDAKLPCARCVSGGTAAECTYELKHQSRPAVVNTPSVSRDKTSSPLRVRDSPSQKSSDGFSVPSTNPLDRPQPAWSDSGESSSHSRSLSPSPPREQPSTVRLPWELSPRIHNELVPRPSSDVSVVRKPQDTVKRVPPPAVPSFAILPSILFQTIPRPLRIPLSLIPPEYMQISDVAGDDLGMTLCVFFVSQFHTGPQRLNDTFSAA